MLCILRRAHASLEILKWRFFVLRRGGSSSLAPTADVAGKRLYINHFRAGLSWYPLVRWCPGSAERPGCTAQGDRGRWWDLEHCLFNHSLIHTNLSRNKSLSPTKRRDDEKRVRVRRSVIHLTSGAVARCFSVLTKVGGHLQSTQMEEGGARALPSFLTYQSRFSSSRHWWPSALSPVQSHAYMPVSAYSPFTTLAISQNKCNLPSPTRSGIYRYGSRLSHHDHATKSRSTSLGMSSPVVAQEARLHC